MVKKPPNELRTTSRSSHLLHRECKPKPQMSRSECQTEHPKPGSLATLKPSHQCRPSVIRRLRSCPLECSPIASSLLVLQQAISFDIEYDALACQERCLRPSILCLEYSMLQ